MKIYLSRPRHHWISPFTILEKVIFWREIDYSEPLIIKWVNRIEPICIAYRNLLNFLHPEIRVIKIDYWDTWSMDFTLSPIILPMLIQLKETNHGSPYVDDEDVPEKLKSTSAPAKNSEWELDENHFLRWDWVMDEMIWTFRQLSDSDHEYKFFDYSEYDKTKDVSLQLDKIKCDRVSLEQHNKRINNGLRLFGKYYRSLWD